MEPLDLISLIEAKAYLKVDFSDEDTLITSLIKASIEEIENLTEQRLYDRSEVLVTSKEVYITPIYPINSITSIIDEDNETLVLNTDYEVTNKTYGKMFEFEDDCIERTITLNVGYTTGTCPENLRLACLNLIEYWYNNRGASDVPVNVMQRISNYRKSPW